MNGKVPKEQDTSVKDRTEADSLRTLAANKAREKLEKGLGVGENKWTLSCPLATRAKPVCQTCCLGKIYKCALEKKQREWHGCHGHPWSMPDLRREEKGYDSGASLGEG